MSTLHTVELECVGQRIALLVVFRERAASVPAEFRGKGTMPGPIGRECAYRVPSAGTGFHICASCTFCAAPKPLKHNIQTSMDINATKHSETHQTDMGTGRAKKYASVPSPP